MSRPVQATDFNNAILIDPGDMTPLAILDVVHYIFRLFAVKISRAIRPMGNTRLHRLPTERDRHQGRNVAPKVEAAVRPPCPPNPRLRAAHVLDHERDVTTGRLDRLALNAEARLEQLVARRRQRLGA